MDRWPLRFLLLALVALPSASCARKTPPGAPARAQPLKLPPVLGPKNPRGEEVSILPGEPSDQGLRGIVGATILTGTGKRIEEGVVLIQRGRILQVGKKGEVQIPSEAELIDATGRWVTPGLIDDHSHLGVYAAPHVEATADGNEMTDPVTPYVFSEHAFWPQDPALWRAVAGGVTTLQILPGSGNVIGGRAVTLRLSPRRGARAMRFPGSKQGLKMACGENPKRVYGSKGRQPMSRMGNIAQLRKAFIEAQAYRHAQREFEEERKSWEERYEKAKKDPQGADDPGKEPAGPSRDLGMEVLADALDGKLLVHVHCYRADEMLQMIELSKELGFRIASFHHAVEAYKIADVLAREGVAASMWADWWGFKLEAYDGIEENIPMVARAGGVAVVHSDSSVGIQRLNQEAAKALYAGRRVGLAISEEEAIAWITKNPATVLGLDDQVGSLEEGKLADVVIWSESPFSIYARAEKVLVGGVTIFDRDLKPKAWSDFEVGSDIEEVYP